MDTEERDFLWGHFVFNAEQRLKAFNFFVIFSVFANGGAFAAVEKSAHGLVFILIGGFVLVLSIVFATIDLRSRRLIKLAVPGLMQYEKRFPVDSRLFAIDSDRHRTIVRYTVAFRVLFTLQFLFGLGTIIYGALKWLDQL